MPMSCIAFQNMHTEHPNGRTLFHPSEVRRHDDSKLLDGPLFRTLPELLLMMSCGRHSTMSYIIFAYIYIRVCLVMQDLDRQQ